MVEHALAAIAASVTVFAGVVAALAVLFRAQVRRYDRTVAEEFLTDWTNRIELTGGDEGAATPPANVLAAMVALPAPGLRGGWNGSPTAAFDGRWSDLAREAGEQPAHRGLGK
jgi:hypothetical protein